MQRTGAPKWETPRTVTTAVKGKLDPPFGILLPTFATIKRLKRGKNGPSAIERR